MPKKPNQPSGDVILLLALADAKEEVDHYLSVEDKRTGSAIHRKAVAKREFLHCLNELASDWFEKQLINLEKYKGKSIIDEIK